MANTEQEIIQNIKTEYSDDREAQLRWISYVFNVKRDNAVKILDGEIKLESLQEHSEIKEFSFDLLGSYIDTLISDIITKSVNVATISDISPAFPEEIGTEQEQVQVVFTTRRDELVCPICLPLDGTVWEIDDLSKPEIPDDTHNHCRCRYLISINGEIQSG